MFMGLVCKRLTVKASVLFRAADFHVMGYVGLLRVKTCVGLLGVKFLMSLCEMVRLDNRNGKR